MKKLIALMLSLLFILAFPTTAFATVADSDSLRIQTTIQTVQRQHPTADIIYENGIVHVYVADHPLEATIIPSSLYGTSNNTEPTSYYAPGGGSWINFVNPWYISPANGDTIPYIVTYFPRDKAEVLLGSYTNSAFWNYVMNIDTSVEPTVADVDAINQAYGLSYSYEQYLFVWTTAYFQLHYCLNANRLSSALNASSSGGVRVDRTTINDVPTNYYYSWTSSYCSNSPWQAFEPEFRYGLFYN